jgi:hypothetical protein
MFKSGAFCTTKSGFEGSDATRRVDNRSIPWR